ncbi:MAG: 7,8-didemethyl-8-hydroxy-5-deazariboflavin synthase CofG [Rhodobacteraceae bacterium]|nr:7,8-didemethyl-8-hydroxy-5-deazariboflavin synthase CofG [Paracoccaceae bacterium]MCY4196902.1 7,8-didemethyl-8-hydroxy-5-deazariboflavin synthase CofG [Paracoccaceae bacterium]
MSHGPSTYLLATDTKTLLARAATKRDQYWGRTVTYSRKIFVPLTNLCRDRCGYCTFARTPDDPASQILTPDDVRVRARQGEAHGCKEILFSLGEKPERRYKVARERLAVLGYRRMTSYLAAMCALVLDETSLLPHVNAGTLAPDEIELLRPVSASMGMMLESVSRRLTRTGKAHHACPDKVPLQRLRTLERAGIAHVPFTTGLLVGIGETWEERLATLEAIEAVHQRYGHIQEVIIQNFRRKPEIAMADHPEPTHDEMLRTIAMARLILSPEISIQAPPNLEARHIHYLAAGLNDWGGISPVTQDYINPHHEWPEIRALADRCRAVGFTLEERLTIYPRYIRQPSRFMAPGIHKRVNTLVREDGLARRQCREAA